MIDTDKYTGHTPTPWVIEEGDMEYGETDTIITVTPPMNFVVANGIMRQDAQLIADAPLLLAEVKRLQKYEKAWKSLYSKVEMSCICFADYPDKQDINSHELMEWTMKEMIE